MKNKSRVVIVGLLPLAIVLFILLGLHIYSNQKSKQVRKIMEVVYKHEPNFSKLEDDFPCARITRVMQSGDKWLVYNTWDIKDERSRHILDGERFMIVQDAAVKAYQHGAVSFLSVNDFYCIGFKKEKSKANFWIFDENGNRTGCIDDSKLHQPHRN